MNKFIVRIVKDGEDEFIDSFDNRKEAIDCLKEIDKTNNDNIDYYIDEEDSSGNLINEEFIDIMELDREKYLNEFVDEWKNNGSYEYVTKKPSKNAIVGEKAYLDIRTGLITTEENDYPIGIFLRDNNDGTAHVQIKNENMMSLQYGKVKIVNKWFDYKNDNKAQHYKSWMNDLIYKNIFDIPVKIPNRYVMWDWPKE